MQSVKQAAIAVLMAAEPMEKVRLSQAAAVAWRSGEIPVGDVFAPPDRPGRSARPVLMRPGDMPRRKVGGSVEKRVALLHALAHIELNAIDLAWDIVARFNDAELSPAFFDDWVRVAAEEALHFDLINQRLAALGASYGDLPAHDGLWRSASDTAHDILARLAIVPLVLEARGLDVTPTMITDLKRIGDEESAGVLQRIYDDEIGHVAAGSRWFNTIAAARGLEPTATWQQLVKEYFRGHLKKPFNRSARDQAGLPVDFYEPLAI